MHSNSFVFSFAEKDPLLKLNCPVIWLRSHLISSSLGFWTPSSVLVDSSEPLPHPRDRLPVVMSLVIGR